MLKVNLMKPDRWNSNKMSTNPYKCEHDVQQFELEMCFGDNLQGEKKILSVFSSITP